MSDDFFEGAAGEMIPGGKLKDIGDMVKGTIAEMHQRDHVPFGQKEPEIDKRTGKPRQEMVFTIQTDDRNWANVVKVPLTDPDDSKSAPKPGSDDDGRRRVYVPKGDNIYYAVGTALRKAGVKMNDVEVGDKIAFKIDDLVDVGKGNPKKEHEVFFQKGEKPSNFFEGESKSEAQAQATEAKASVDPWANARSSDAAPF